MTRDETPQMTRIKPKQMKAGFDLFCLLIRVIRVL
jgi:hypothetical protein